MTNYHEHADQAFFEKSRKLSPKFPNASTVRLRRQQMQETVAARVLLGGFFIFGMCAIFAADWHFHALAAGLCAVGFITTCVVAGNRAHNRAGASNGRPGA